MRKISLTFLILLLGVLAACGPASDDAGPPTFESDAAPATTAPVVVTPEDDRTLRTTPLIEAPLPPTVEPLSTSQPLGGEVPDELLTAILRDLGERSGAAMDEIEVERAEQAIWNDGSLGCPQPGEVYTQAPVTGYWVVLSVDGREYDYRVGERGFFFPCEDPSRLGNELPTG